MSNRLCEACQIVHECQSAICLDRQSKAFLPNPTSTQYITPTFNKTKKTDLSRKQLLIINKTRVTLKHVDFVWNLRLLYQFIFCFFEKPLYTIARVVAPF
jgi:hypothetical protein